MKGFFKLEQNKSILKTKKPFHNGKVFFHKTKILFKFRRKEQFYIWIFALRHLYCKI